MTYLVGIGQKIISDVWAGQEICPCCGEKTHHHLKRVVCRGYMFYIPFFFVTEKRYTVCDKCDGAKQLNKNEYKEIRNKQKAFYYDNLPREIIEKDFCPEMLKVGLKTFVFVLASLLLLIMLPISFSAGPLFFLPLSIGVIPFAFALKNFITAKKKQKIFKAITHNGGSDTLPNFSSNEEQ